MNKHTGSTFDSFLDEEGIKAEMEAVAAKRVAEWQMRKAIKAGTRKASRRNEPAPIVSPHNARMKADERQDSP